MNKVPERVLEMRKMWAQGDAMRDAGLTEPEDIEKYRDISYGPYDTWNLLDLYIPKDVSSNANKAENAKWPVIVSIHGGGFFYGDKKLYRFYCMHLAQFGFAVVNFNYRLAPEFNFPSPLEDTMKVMEWISANAGKYSLDTSNVFMVGDSAGAQLVSHFACIMSNKDFAGLFGMTAPADITIKAVSLACGTYSLVPETPEDRRSSLLLDYLGDEKMFEDPRIMVKENITGDYPPVYIFSAYNDFLYSVCEPMAKFIESHGVEVKCRIFGSVEAKEIGHVFHVNMRLEEGEKANAGQTDFFRAHIN